MSLLLGCGSNYRPVVAAINPVGPAEQPQQSAVALATTGPSTPGVVNIVNAFGDTTMDVLNLPNNNPLYLAMGTASGSTAYSINSDGSVNYFPTGNQTLSADISSITLPIKPSFVLPHGTFNYVTLPVSGGQSFIGSLQSISPPTLRQQIPVPGTPVYIAGVEDSVRVYAVSNGVSPGKVTAIESSTNTVSNSITVHQNPVFDLMSIDQRRVYVLNNGSNDVSVINGQTNQLDSFHDPVTNVLTDTLHDPAAIGPVWADFAPTLNELVVLNSGGGGGATGSVSIFNIPLCSVTTSVSNPNCDASNPVDAVGFGTLIANIPVGVNPFMVKVLEDGSEAFIANAGTSTTAGSVTVINLRTNSVVATIPAAADGVCNPVTPTTANPLKICGHPVWIDGTAGSPTGKVFIVSADSTNMTVLRSDINAVSAHVPLSGYGVSVRVGH